MSLRRRSLLFLLIVLGLLAGSIVAIILKPTVLGLDLKGGAQVILEARPTAESPVNADSLRRAEDIIRNRVDRLGVAEPEIQTQGTNQISVALPAVTDPKVISDLVKPAQLSFYAYQPNLVGYQSYPAPPLFENPSTDLYSLIKRAQETPPRSDSGGQPSVYLFRKGSPPQYVAGPGTSRKELTRSLEITQKELFDELARSPRSFEFLTVPKGFLIVTDGDRADPNGPRCGEGGLCTLLHNRVGLVGKDVKSANLGFDGSQPVVEMQFTGDGSRKFQAITREIAQGGLNEGRPATAENSQFWTFAVILDGVIISNPTIDYNDLPFGIEGGRAQIQGGFTEGSARTLADQLNSGAIPVVLQEVSSSTVSATLGEQSLRQGLIAGFIGLGVVIIALIAYYRLLGVVASIALVVYGLYFLAIAKLVPIALTLPGIAGLILTIGVAADANIVIFERVREEARAGRPPRIALLNGYRRGITAIIDANVVTLVTAGLLFLLSTSGPRGFAFTLVIGVVISLFTAVIATQAAFGLLIETKLFQNERLMGLNVREIKWKFDIVGKWRMWLAISFIPMLIGVAIIGINGLEPGLDFKSGTNLTVGFTQQQPDENAIRDELSALGYGDAKIQGFTRTVEGREVSGFEIQTETLDAAKTDQVIQRLESSFGQTDDAIAQVQSVGPTFGRQIVRNAIYAILFSFLAIIAYLTIRFEYKLALPALLSVVHDVWLALTVYSIAGKEVTSATVAALLTILGYSLYDVVIVFDRIRENQPLMRGQPYRAIVNRSVHETLTRSIITLISTLLPVLALYLFGGETLNDFAFALLVGILAGGVSSIFIAAPIAALWKEREPDARRAAARTAKKAARVSTVDADIIDVDALARAEAQLQGQLDVPEEGDGVAVLVERPADQSPLPETAPNGSETLPEQATDGEPPKPTTGDASTPAPQRERRHRQVQRKRRR